MKSNKIIAICILATSLTLVAFTNSNDSKETVTILGNEVTIGLNIGNKAPEIKLNDPNGKEIAFIFHGEVFVTSVKEGTTKRITNTPEQERTIDYSPDGRAILYASERNGSWNL